MLNDPFHLMERIAAAAEIAAQENLTPKEAFDLFAKALRFSAPGESGGGKAGRVECKTCGS